MSRVWLKGHCFILSRAQFMFLFSKRFLFKLPACFYTYTDDRVAAAERGHSSGSTRTVPNASDGQWIYRAREHAAKGRN